MRSSVVRGVLAFIVLLALGIAIVVSLKPSGSPPIEDPRPRPSVSTGRTSGPSNEVPFGYEDPGIEIPPGSTVTAPHFDLSQLDFEALRAKTPDSLYWLLAAPTEDPNVLDARAREKKRRNDQYGRVLSSTATVEEIEDYYVYRRRLSEDYVEVSQLILDAHGDDLADRDVGLLELTIALHASRLSEIPQKLDDALRRKAEYDEVKRAWQAQQETQARERNADTTTSPD